MIPTQKITLGALFMAITIILSSAILSIPVPGGHLYACDIIIVLTALLFKPKEACIIAGFGSFLEDFFFYPAPMFVSLITHGLQAFTIAYTLKKTHGHQSFPKCMGALILGLIIMVVGYSLGRAFIYATPEYALLKLPFEFLQAGLGVVVGYLIYRNTPIKKLFKQSFKTI